MRERKEFMIYLTELGPTLSNANFIPIRSEYLELRCPRDLLWPENPEQRAPEVVARLEELIERPQGLLIPELRSLI